MRKLIEMYGNYCTAKQELTEAIVRAMPVGHLVEWEHGGRPRFGIVKRHAGERVQVIGRESGREYWIGFERIMFTWQKK